jgi:hypothetical protein
MVQRDRKLDLLIQSKTAVDDENRITILTGTALWFRDL